MYWSLQTALFSQEYDLAYYTTYVSGGTYSLKSTPYNSFMRNFSWQVLFTLMVFSFLPKNVHFISKNAMLCLFLKNVSPSKRVISFILNNLHFPMVEGTAFYTLHKSRVLIIPCKADGFCFFIGLPDEIYKCRLVSLSNLELNFFLVLWSNLREALHY